jgi:8-oxo-dGTP pyrophosphatase MutT (NUDIX family)
MYDMFVGGVSLAGEDGATTALREVAEELGLSGNSQQLSEPLLTCVVCTAYNRCVVTLFAYTMDQAAESIRWQAEEVAWGSFVPYEVVEAAADRSIMRWVDQDKWPGRVPPIQSPRHGNVSRFTDFDWTTWDIVPDGLLVWEAWLRREDAVHSSDVHDTATIVRNSTR